MSVDKASRLIKGLHDTVQTIHNSVLQSAMEEIRNLAGTIDTKPFFPKKEKGVKAFELGRMHEWTLPSYSWKLIPGSCE